MTEKHHDLDGCADEVLGQATRQDEKTKIAILLVCIALLVVLAISVFRDDIFPSWRHHQNKYLEILRNKATDDWGKALADNYEVQIAQIYIPELDISDRCISCHRGIDDPRMTDVPNPYKFHPGDHLKDHDPQEFGCTTCHDGQGRATTREEAHGEVDRCLYPLLTGESAYSSCSKCHFENDLYGGQEELFAMEDSVRPLSSRALDATIPGFGNNNSLSIVRGKKLILNSGCLGCHKYRGRGGTVGPDITHTGDKTVHGFLFEHVDGPRTVPQWLFEHFKRPAVVSPDTLMPDMNFTDRQARDLTNYMLSLRRKTMPAKYMFAPKAYADTPASGRQLFSMFCSGCHGADGSGSTVPDPKTGAEADVPVELMVPSLNNSDTLAVASDQYLESIIRNGRGNTNMIGWSSHKQGHLADEEIAELVKHIRLWQKPPADLSYLAARPGNKLDGSEIYKERCAFCHGSDGEGSIGPSLNSNGFLSVASDRFLGLAIIHGRPNTAMPSYRDLDTQGIRDVIAHMRSWGELKSQKDKVVRLVASAGRHPSVSADIGETVYVSRCLNCHGPDGKGDLGPSISKQEYLSVVDAGYLYETLAHGREGTAMPSGHDMTNVEMASLIAYIESWLISPRKKLPLTSIDGDRDAGKALFAQMCANCHGENAEGASGPQLANHQFLNQTTDPMLSAWVAHGKLDTAIQGIAGITESQIYNITAYLRSLQYAELPPINKFTSGRPDRGQEWFAEFCSSCHGAQGEGASGPSLANHQFLSVASSGYLMATMAIGRDGTEMKPVKKGPQSILALGSDQMKEALAYLNKSDPQSILALSSARIDDVVAHLNRDDPKSVLALDSDQVNDVLAYLRTLEYSTTKDEIMHNFVIERDLERGRALYESNCSECHGVNGRAKKSQEGKLTVRAPELNNKQFLDSATDGFLQATIISGRQGTAMKPFGLYPNEGVNVTPEEVDEPVNLTTDEENEPANLTTDEVNVLVKLKPDEVDDIVAYIRGWSGISVPINALPVEGNTEHEE